MAEGNIRPTRRQVVRGLTVAGVAAAAGGPGLGATSRPATTRSADAITAGDVGVVNEVLDHPYTAAESELMVDGLAGKREVIARFRKQAVAYNTPPAISFAVVVGAPQDAGGEGFGLSDRAALAYGGDPATLAFASAADLSRLIHVRKVTSVELTKMYLGRLKEIGPRLNCVVTLTEELALSQARRADEELAAGKSRGPLHGIPWGAKDLLAAKGYPTTWGVEIYKDRVFDHDAAVVERLEAAGAVLCAKLSLGELCMGDTWFKGMTRCPWNPKEGSSGSSAGPCAAVAAGMVGFAIGSETLGSIVSPCMVNGTVGLRPTYGRVSRAGAMPLSNTMEKLGPIARSVEDCAMVLAAIHGPDPRDASAVRGVGFEWKPGADLKGLRVGFDPNAFNFDTDVYRKNPALKALYEDGFKQMRDLVGKDLVPVRLPLAKEYAGLASLVIACESSCNFTGLLTSGDIRKLKQQGEGTWPNTFRVGSTVPAADYLRGMQVRTQLMGAMAECMREVDCYLTLPYAGPTISYTNLTGHPSVVFRAGMFKGRPKLFELIGQPFGEASILGIAHTFEGLGGHGGGEWPDTSKIPALG